jgi:hypothetical protein
MSGDVTPHAGQVPDPEPEHPAIPTGTPTTEETDPPETDDGWVDA